MEKEKIEKLQKKIKEMSKRLEEYKKIANKNAEACIKLSDDLMNCKKKILDDEIKWLEKYIDETTKMRIDAVNKYGSIGKIPKNILVTLRINTVTEHRIRLESLKKIKDGKM
jgi:DNA repair exonuclease SbcCD ATPase subunit